MNLQKGELYRRLYEALPDEKPVQEWTLEECKRVKRALRPLFKHSWLRADAFEIIESRINEIRNGKGMV